MSDDLLNRLKYFAFKLEGKGQLESAASDTMVEAAARFAAHSTAIDGLRADLATQQGCCDGAAAQDAHVRREREEMQSAKADAWDDGYEAHSQMIEVIARKPSNPYR